jgi:hypothetical protein
MPEILLVNSELVGEGTIGTRVTVLIASGNEPPIAATLISSRFSGNFTWETYNGESSSPINFPMSAEDVAMKAMRQLNQTEPHPSGYTVPGRED